jgi:hypothetical protein
MKIKRVYHPCEKWEELDHNMWGKVEDRAAMFLKAVEFTSNHKLYGAYMMRVIREWPISCENALTDQNLNQKAWVGHAACALALRCPEDITRRAWGYLTDEQRFLANREAARAIACWLKDYRKSREVHRDVGIQMLLCWNSG